MFKSIINKLCNFHIRFRDDQRGGGGGGGDTNGNISSSWFWWDADVKIPADLPHPSKDNFGNPIFSAEDYMRKKQMGIVGYTKKEGARRMGCVGVVKVKSKESGKPCGL